MKIVLAYAAFIVVNLIVLGSALFTIMSWGLYFSVWHWIGLVIAVICTLIVVNIATLVGVTMTGWVPIDERLADLSINDDEIW